jgi:DNA-binding MarR family transcriptional regulator
MPPHSAPRDPAPTGGVLHDLLADAFPAADLDVAAVTMWLGEVSRRVQFVYQSFLRGFDLDYSEYTALVALRVAEPEPQSATALGRRVVLTSGGMAKALTRLERRGLVARTDHPDDGRSALVRLTDAGRAAVDDVLAADLERHTDMLGDLGADDRRALVATLEHLATRLRS